MSSVKRNFNSKRRTLTYVEKEQDEFDSSFLSKNIVLDMKNFLEAKTFLVRTLSPKHELLNLPKMTEKVWLRFEKKAKDGKVLKLRIQDLPQERLDEALELRLKHFVRDEVVHKATGITKNPEAVEQYRIYLNKVMHNPRNRTVICCEDNDDKVGDIMGVSGVTLVEEDFNWDEIAEMLKQLGATEEMKKLAEVFMAASDMYKPMKKLNLKEYFDDDTVLVLPDYRRLGIAQQFLKTRRLMCAVLGVPKAGGWMTGYGTQIAAARDGWETVFELKYDDLARDHGLVFEDAPPTMKYMIAGPLKSSRTDSLVKE